MILRRLLTRKLVFKLNVNFALTKNCFSSNSSSPNISHLTGKITVKVGATPENLYPKLQHRYPHLWPPRKAVPTDGIDLTVNYADSAFRNPQKKFKKVIVAVHGTPGYFRHFDRLIEHYHNQNELRIVAPNLPDFDHTRKTGKIFWHTTDEKVSFLKSFLRRLNIGHIDCLISHSLGVQTTTALFEHPQEMQIKSMVIIAAQPIWDMNPTKHKFVQNIFRFQESELWYHFLAFLKMHNSQMTPVQFASVNEFLWLMASTRDFQTPDDLLRRIYKLVHQAPKVPVTIQFGSREPLVSRKTLDRFFKAFELKKGDLIELDVQKDGEQECVQKVAAEEREGRKKRIKAYILEGGSHFSHAKYHNLTVQMIDNIINHN